MDKNKWLAAQFQTHREHLQDVAYRMLGSMSEADDAVQECWLRASLADTTGVANFGGWLTTIIGRICLDALRTRKRRREEPLEVLEAKEESTPIAETSLSPDQVVQITD